MNEHTQRDAEAHDRSLDVIDALALVDVKMLSYVQLRRLYAALTHASEGVGREISLRSAAETDGDTVRVPSPGSQ